MDDKEFTKNFTEAATRARKAYVPAESHSIWRAKMSGGHFIVKCKECQTVLTQCRCPDPNKKVIWDICVDGKCKKPEKKGDFMDNADGELEERPTVESRETDSSFRQKLERIINEHSLENESDTPDYLLADFMIHCLTIFNGAVVARREWHSTENTKDWDKKMSQTVPERIRERVMVDMGQASMCWSNAFEREGVYETEQATEIGDKLCQFIMDEIEASHQTEVVKTSDR